jgi:hypothetical protein
MKKVFLACCLCSTPGLALILLGGEVTLEGPAEVPCFDPAELVLRISPPPQGNPFTEIKLTGLFKLPGSAPVSVLGFCDSPDGQVFRLRFSPSEPGATYRYDLRIHGAGIDKVFQGELKSKPSDRPGPVIADPERPKHFRFGGTMKPFYHLGFTAYHLLDPSNDLAQVDATIDYCARNGFNKIRFLLAGYPRDFDQRTSQDEEHGVPDPWKRPNYGAKPGQVQPLPAWEGKPHQYDFTRFNVSHWQRVDHAVRRMRDAGIVATGIFTIEKQDLPSEYGRLSENELRLYRYAVSRLAAFDNIWWDLGNEHNEYRDPKWGDAMGAFVKAIDPYGRLASAHGYAEFSYSKSSWADFIITQEYGDERTVHGWALSFASTPKPYVNEEYGYEGTIDKPGHGQSRDWVRRCHWSIAMAGGYATYGDWSGGVSYFYMGEPGPGKAALELKHLRSFFEKLPCRDLVPHDELVKPGFCLAKPPLLHVFYFYKPGQSQIDLQGVEKKRLTARWFDPRAGSWKDGPELKAGQNGVSPPEGGDWALWVQAENP